MHSFRIGKLSQISQLSFQGNVLSTQRNFHCSKKIHFWHDDGFWIFIFFFSLDKKRCLNIRSVNKTNSHE